MIGSVNRTIRSRAVARRCRHRRHRHRFRRCYRRRWCRRVVGAATARGRLGVALDGAGHEGGELRVERHPLHRVLGQRPVVDRRELLRLERERPLHVGAPDRGRDVAAERRVAVQVGEGDLALGVAHPDAGREVGRVAAEPGVLVVVGGAGLAGLDAPVGELRRCGGGAAADRPLQHLVCLIGDAVRQHPLGLRLVALEGTARGDAVDAGHELRIVANAVRRPGSSRRPSSTAARPG